MAVTLTLGGVVFAGFEIPETINFGGDQKLTVHKLPGGKRVIDAMGPDDADIRWSGRFRGESGEQRGILLDFMRRQGQKALLAWGLHRYQVVIRSFEANYQNPYEIPYSIACTVVVDEAQAVAKAAFGIAASLAADLAAATGLTALIGEQAVTEAVTAVAGAISNYQAGVPSATNALAFGAAVAEGALLDGVLSSVTGAQAAVAGSITATDAGIPGASLTSQAAGFGKLNHLYRLDGSLGRMATNLKNLGG
jgi:hypothetical protein